MERLEEERGRHLVEVEETMFRMDKFDEETKAKLDFGGEEEKEATASVVKAASFVSVTITLAILAIVN